MATKIVSFISFIFLFSYVSCHAIPSCQNSTTLNDDIACFLLASCNYTLCGINPLTGDTQWFKNLCVMQLYNVKCFQLFIPTTDSDCTTPKPTATTDGLCLVPNILPPNLIR